MGKRWLHAVSKRGWDFCSGAFCLGLGSGVHGIHLSCPAEGLRQLWAGGEGFYSAVPCLCFTLVGQEVGKGRVFLFLVSVLRRSCVNVTGWGCRERWCGCRQGGGPGTWGSRPAPSPAEARGSWSSARGPGPCTAPAHQIPLPLRRGRGSPEDPDAAEA